MSWFGIDKTSLVPVNADKPPLLKEDGPKTPSKEYMPGVSFCEAVEAIMRIITVTRPGISSAARTIVKFC